MFYTKEVIVTDRILGKLPWTCPECHHNNSADEYGLYKCCVCEFLVIIYPTGNQKDKSMANRKIVDNYQSFIVSEVFCPACKHEMDTVQEQEGANRVQVFTCHCSHCNISWTIVGKSLTPIIHTVEGWKVDPSYKSWVCPSCGTINHSNVEMSTCHKCNAAVQVRY